MLPSANSMDAVSRLALSTKVSCVIIRTAVRDTDCPPIVSSGHSLAVSLLQSSQSSPVDFLRRFPGR